MASRSSRSLIETSLCTWRRSRLTRAEPWSFFTKCEDRIRWACLERAVTCLAWILFAADRGSHGNRVDGEINAAALRDCRLDGARGWARAIRGPQSLQLGSPADWPAVRGGI